MLQSILVYGLLSLSLFVLGKNAEAREVYNNGLHQKTSFWTWETIVILFLFAFISGVRWNVGVDHQSYLRIYQDYITFGHSDRNLEWGFSIVTLLFAKLEIHFSIYFGFWAFLQIFFIYYALKDERYLWPFIGVIIIMGSHYLSWMNGIRQMLAACMFVYSIQFIRDRKIIPYFLIILIASLFHKSALFLIIFYFIPQKDYFKNRYINLVLCVLTLIIGLNPYWLQATSFIEIALSSLGYEGYADRLDVWIDLKREMSLGPRRISILLLNMIVIWFAPKLKVMFKNTNFLTYFNFMVIGVLLYNLFANAAHIFLRPVSYFTIFSAVTVSYLLYYLKTKAPKELYILIFIIAISYMVFSLIAESAKGDMDTTNYKFFWDYV
ncbi:MAG: EpsG family protein [Proteiniphilum sp.]|uniref:EpsG family protein n=1 Tax=Proteiniphilum sp. TaxID=1926877 RepID=UPI002B211C6E|nr:EpsG family protein [Proteiniphilum sp.]MEA5129358.1 EpsG family protein [Proteiniphilum sp.]